MKKIILSLGLALTTIFASDFAVTSNFDKDGSALIHAKGEIAYVYHRKDSDMISGDDLTIGASVIAYKICKDESLRAVIDGGTAVEFIYVSKNKATIVRVDECPKDKQ